MKHLLLLLCLPLIFSCNKQINPKLSLEGEWQVMLDSLDQGQAKGWNNTSFDTKISLPGTTDAAEIGVKNSLEPKLEKPQLLHLTRKNSYIGAAYYTRLIEIPSSFEGKRTVLNLERVLWTSEVYIDGQKVESKENNSLITPHRHDLTAYLKPGQTQRLTIKVDNRQQFDISVNKLAHAYTDDTQIIWNGILGDISIETTPDARVYNLMILPNIQNRSVKVLLTTLNDGATIPQANITLYAKEKYGNKTLPKIEKTAEIRSGKTVIDLDYSLGEDAKLWSEFDPSIYKIYAEVDAEGAISHSQADFGLREIGRNGSILTINDNPLFLRGTLECAIFPLTGTPPTDQKGWEKVFVTAREWGLNHLRFHSWCPPKAAFEVADKMGFYLQVELPLWVLTVGAEKATTDFLYAEADRLIRNYGNHPSFCLMSMGNELQGNMNVLAELTRYVKANDPRHLYTTTSFTFEKGFGDWPEADDDFFITQWTKKGWVRGQGVFNSYAPTFDKDYSAAVDSMTVPLITHEIGQYSVYPNLSEIEKYTGVLDPLNFKAVRDDLIKKGLIDKAAKYTHASGRLAALLYKEEIERAHKTAGISGYQLLDLHDFPGQGTALVGLLDAFWDSKGVISAEDFRGFSSPLVPLVRYPKAVYTNDESFKAQIDVSNYTLDEIKDRSLKCELYDSSKRLIAEKSVPVTLKRGYNSSVGEFTAELKSIAKASKLTLKIAMEGTDYKNSWNFWVYPAQLTVDYKEVKYTRNVNEAMAMLDKGEKVLLNPNWKETDGIEGKFVPVFWSPVHFPKQAGTMGLLCDEKHPALKNFPNNGHTDWQWWDLCINSVTMVVDSLKGGSAVVEMVDNFTGNRRLASVFEGKVGKGQLLVTSYDLNSELNSRPVAKQMLYSLVEYMNSEQFQPTEIQNPQVITRILQTKANAKKESTTSIY